MRRTSSKSFAVLAGGFLAVNLASVAACGGGSNSQFGDGGASSSGSGGSGSGSGSLIGGDDGGGSGDGSVQCPSNLSCNVSCSGGGTTSISGVVYDPAGTNPLYDIEVYVPATPLQALPKGVPTGADACNCGALFKSGAVASTSTKVDGSFKITNAPVGTMPLVIQVGKWRREVMITTKACQDNTPSVKLTLPGTLAGAGPNDNMPDIAVSTGSADTLECLMQRIGIPASEYGNGATGAGHVHLFSGGQTGGGGGGGGGVGRAERPGWGAPASDGNLWDSPAHLMPYDITLLSCEGGETYNANPQNLESYLNAGGRVFSSHFHYAWFSGPNLPGGSNQAYTAPADWGGNLAAWTAGSNAGMGMQSNGKIDQTLNVNGQPFAKGQALYQWLGLVNALGVLGAPPMELPMVPPRFNAVVSAANKPSQPWVIDDMTPNTMYFSFDTPVNAMASPDGGAPAYCGRAVFSDLHVSGNQLDPSGAGGGGGGTPSCDARALSPQEKALEFMLFDLSACVIPDTVAPPDGGIPISQ